MNVFFNHHTQIFYAVSHILQILSYNNYLNYQYFFLQSEQSFVPRKDEYIYTYISVHIWSSILLIQRHDCLRYFKNHNSRYKAKWLVFPSKAQKYLIRKNRTRFHKE